MFSILSVYPQYVILVCKIWLLTNTGLYKVPKLQVNRSFQLGLPLHIEHFIFAHILVFGFLLLGLSYPCGLVTDHHTYLLLLEPLGIFKSNIFQ